MLGLLTWFGGVLKRTRSVVIAIPRRMSAVRSYVDHGSCHGRVAEHVSGSGRSNSNNIPQKRELILKSILTLIAGLPLISLRHVSAWSPLCSRRTPDHRLLRRSQQQASSNASSISTTQSCHVQSSVLLSTFAFAAISRSC
jgi:hypothetical protein